MNRGTQTKEQDALGNDDPDTSYGTIICAAVLAVLGLVGLTLGLRKALKVTGADRANIICAHIRINFK
jgi:hypothetical protein